MSIHKETLGEIIAVISILIKFGFDNIIEDKSLFISFLNELKIKINGNFVTKENLYELTQDITTREKSELIEEFMVGHEPLYRRLTMVLA